MQNLMDKFGPGITVLSHEKYVEPSKKHADLVVP